MSRWPKADVDAKTSMVAAIIMRTDVSPRIPSAAVLLVTDLPTGVIVQQILITAKDYR